VTSRAAVVGCRIAGPASNHAYLVHKMPPAELAAVIEELLLAPPRRDK
jgi:hypothetical protein